MPSLALNITSHPPVTPTLKPEWETRGMQKGAEVITLQRLVSATTSVGRHHTYSGQHPIDRVLGTGESLPKINNVSRHHLHRRIAWQILSLKLSLTPPPEDLFHNGAPYG